MSAKIEIQMESTPRFPQHEIDPIHFSNGKSARITVSELPDMMSASEGEGCHGKADVVREVLHYKSDPNADKGSFADIIYESSHT